MAGTCKAPLVLVLCSGYTPEASGPSPFQARVPPGSDGITALTFAVRRIDVRAAVAGLAPAEVVCAVEKSTSSGAFSSVGTIGLSPTLSSGEYEANVLPAGETVQSGNKLRVNFSSSDWSEFPVGITVQLLLEEV